MNYGQLNQRQRQYLMAVIDAVNRQDSDALEGYHEAGTRDSLLPIYTHVLAPVPQLVQACHNRLVYNLHYKRAPHANSQQ